MNAQKRRVKRVGRATKKGVLLSKYFQVIGVLKMILVLESFKGEKDGPANSRPAHYISTQQGSFR